MKNLDGISIPFTVSFYDRGGNQHVYPECTDYEIKDGVLMFVTGKSTSKVIHYFNLNTLLTITID